MADQRSTIGEDFVHVCNDIYNKYNDDRDTSIKCQHNLKPCDNVIFAELHKGFRSRNLLVTDSKLQAHLTLDSILKDIESVLRATSQCIQSVKIGSYRHHDCCKLNEIVQSLQQKVANIESLHLATFSRRPERTYGCTWDQILQKAGAYPPMPSFLYICPYGDMDIVLKSPVIDATYRVSSRQLRARSPVFCDLISPQAVAPAHTGQRHKLEVENVHDCTALAVVLYILHAQVEKLPERILFDNLVEIAVVCDYYRCASALMPWDEEWMKHWTRYADTFAPGYEDGLFVWWVFEVEGCFRQATKLFAGKGFFQDDEFMVAVNDEHKNPKKLHPSIPQAIIGMVTYSKFGGLHNHIYAQIQ